MNKAEQQGIALQKGISERIRKLRVKKKWSLDKLANAAGFSKGYLSQIENCEKNPPIGTLTKIAFGLGVDVIYLITGEDRKANDRINFSIVRAGERRPILHRGAPIGYRYDSVTYKKTDRIMDAYVISMGPESPKEPLIHEGQEISFALEGRFEFNYDGQWIDVEPGDCLCFDSNRPHFSRSIDGQRARVLVIFSNPQKNE